MSEPTPIRKADKPPRPAHVIMLAEVAGLLADYPKVEGLVVSWYAPASGQLQSYSGFRTLGSSPDLIWLVENFKHALLSGDMIRTPAPTDGPAPPKPPTLPAPTSPAGGATP